MDDVVDKLLGRTRPPGRHSSYILIPHYPTTVVRGTSKCNAATRTLKLECVAVDRRINSSLVGEPRLARYAGSAGLYEHPAQIPSS